MAYIVALENPTKSAKVSVTHLDRSQNIYFLTGTRDAPVISGQGLPANAFPTYICQHRDDWILYAGSNACLQLNGRVVLLERRLLKEGDVLEVGESGSLEFLMHHEG
jgi:hypothetical protein